MSKIQHSLDRRKFLKLATSFAAVGVSLSAYDLITNAGGSHTVASADWNIPEKIVLSPNAAFDLKHTLPDGIKNIQNGRFKVDHRGGQLPAHVSLSPEGLLSVHSSVEKTEISGVIFVFES